MYRFLLILLPVVGMATATGAQQRQDMNKGGSDHKILVAYFSATGTTARAAKKTGECYGRRALCDCVCTTLYECRPRLE